MFENDTLYNYSTDYTTILSTLKKGVKRLLILLLSLKNGLVLKHLSYRYSGMATCKLHKI